MNKQGKVWGWTSEIFSKNNVDINLINSSQGGFCSKHKHHHKHNMFFILSGQMEIKIWKNDYDLIDTTILEKEQFCVIAPGEYHMFRSLSEKTMAIEIYWVELDKKDIIRDDVGGQE